MKITLKNRIRFTVAHELAHYFNDKDYLESNGRIEDSSKLSKKWLFRAKEGVAGVDEDMYKRDVLANRFAADLLMPKNEFIRKWKESRSTEDVAEYFNVSPIAAKVRAAVLVGKIV